MELPLAFVVVVTNLLLIAAGFLVFLPDRSAQRLGPRSPQRAWDKYGRYLLAAVAVLVLHLVLVQLDVAITERLGLDFTPHVVDLEGEAVLALQALWTPFLNAFFSIVYLVVHPWMLYFTPLLFLISDDERATKASLVQFPLAYAMALPFYLFFPVTNVFTTFGIATPLAEELPALWNNYYDLTTVNNTFPSLHVALAILLANATRYSRNTRFRYFAFAYAAAVTFSVLYLNIHWLIDVAGGIALAIAVATLTGRILSVERLALQRVKPTPEEAGSVIAAAHALVTRVTGAATARGVTDVEPMLVGSVAKDTYLKDKIDFDVFMLFPTSVPRSDLERTGLLIARDVIPDGEEKYAEHPYLHGRWERWDADVVPAYKVESAADRMSAVDRTPFHTRFVLERATREQRDEIRLLKQFMIGTGVYGAEARVRGFSGYLCELLVLKYGTFRGAVKAAAQWAPGTFLSLEVHEGNPRFEDPLVFLDPVDPDRNVASAVAEGTLQQFTDACKAFLHREGLSYFFPRQLVPLPPEDLERTVAKRRGDFVLVTFPKPDVLDDHLHDQMRKAERAVIGLLERHEFDVKRVTSAIAGEDVHVLLELARLRLPEGIVHTGPPVKARVHADRFRQRWTGHPEALGPVFEEDGRLRVKRRREFRRAEDLLRAKLPDLDLGKHVSQKVREDFHVKSREDVVTESTTLLVTRHFSRAKPWEL